METNPKLERVVLLVVLLAGLEFAYWTSTNDCGRSIPFGAERMKAIRFCKYGSPDDVLKLEEIEEPAPNDKFATFGVSFTKQDLGILRDLIESGKVVPAVTQTYPLAERAAAYKYLETGHARGKVVITLD